MEVDTLQRQELISVIMPAFNAEPFIASGLKSVLDQGYEHVEIVVVDDGSSDRTAEVAEQFAPTVRCIRQSNAGAPAARNRGLMAAKGEFITFLDADDVYEPGRLGLQMRKLMGNPEIEFVVGQRRSEELCSAPGEPLAFTPIEPPNKMTLSLGACLFRLSAFEKVGNFDESLRHCDDWDWFMRAREMDIPMLIHTDVVLCTRLHLQNLTRNKEDGQRYLALMLKRSIDRRRKASGEAKSLASFSSSLEPQVPDGKSG